MAKYLDCKNSYNKDDLKEAANYIKEGKLVLFPTETIYGLGADGLNEEAVKAIYVAKKRASDNPLILHISNIEMVNDIAKEVTDIEKKLMEKFFPGPLTIIFPKKDIVPSVAVGGLDTVAVRMPSNKIAHDLIELANTPIAAPSANIAGRPSGTNIEDIFNELNDRVDYIIDGGQTEIGLESTVVRVVDGKIHILRPGKITKEELETVGETIVDSHVLGDIAPGEKVLSPGMKYRHYAPESKCLLIYSKDNSKFIAKVHELEEKENCLVLCRTSNLPNFKNALDLGESLEDISKNIFTTLRKVDSYHADLVIIEGVSTEGLGLAIMNRLIRSCSHNYIEL